MNEMIAYATYFLRQGEAALQVINRMARHFVDWTRQAIGSAVRIAGIGLRAGALQQANPNAAVRDLFPLDAQSNRYRAVVTIDVGDPGNPIYRNYIVRIDPEMTYEQILTRIRRSLGQRFRGILDTVPGASSQDIVIEYYYIVPILDD